MFILWVGFFFFNGASGLDMFGPRKNGPSKIILNTAIASAMSGLVAVFLKPYSDSKYMKVNQFDVGVLCNGILSGLVSICAACNAVEPYDAFIIGSISGLVFILGVKLEAKLKLDDPVDAFALHLCCGTWGIISAGFFHN